MTQVQVCRECGKLYPFLARGVCGDCQRAREEKFYVVRDWLRENPRAHMDEAAAACEVEASLVQEWVQEGRLSFTHQAVAGESQSEAAMRERLRQELLASGGVPQAAAAKEPPKRLGMQSRHHG